MISSPTKNLKTRVGQDSVAPWLFSLPAILMLLAFLVAPFVLAIVFSFTTLSLLSPIPLRFVATVWRLLYAPDAGFINGLLGAVSGGAVHPNWLRSTSTAFLAIIIMSIWQGVGFQMVILLAGLQDIPQDHYEAAIVDGASGWQQFRFVTIPQLRNQLLFVVTITTILAFRLFDQVYVMTSGGPLDSTQTLMLMLVDVGFGRQ